LREHYARRKIAKVLNDCGMLHSTLALEHLSTKIVDETDIKSLAEIGEPVGFQTPARHRWLKIATEDKDRAGDIMSITGCDTTNFEKNPQFLWHHGLAGLAVHTLGRIRKIVKTDTALFALAEYAEEGIYDFADQIWRMDCAGLLPANSIGFHPIEWETLDDGGHRFTKWELIECSKVELPMNPNAVDEPAALPDLAAHAKLGKSIESMHSIDSIDRWLAQ
jgi:hypothetical protein